MVGAGAREGFGRRSRVQGARRGGCPALSHSKEEANETKTGVAGDCRCRSDRRHSRCVGGSASAVWQLTRPVEFNVPAGTGGRADIMARFLSLLLQKNNITKQPWIVVNPSASAWSCRAGSRV